MRHPSEEILARYARGDEEVTLRPMIEAHLARCADCERAVARLRAEAPGLDEGSDGDAGDAALLSKILARLEREEAAAPPAPSALPPGVFPGAVLATLPAPARWSWISMWPARGRIAELVREPSGARLLAVYYEAGVRSPRHAHRADEHSVVLAGGYRSGDRTLNAGDWDYMPPGSEHAPAMLPDEGCWCLVRIGPAGSRYTGLSAWRRALVALRAARRRRAERRV